MKTAARRRRSAQEEESSENERPRSTQRRKQRQRNDDDEGEEENDEDNGGDGMDVDSEEDSQDQLVKKLVRYALACEYQRMPIRRTGISEKVIGKQRGRFKGTFDAAQKHLRTKFGMELVELPVREKVTLKERRAAQKSKSGSSSSTSYVLTSILPTKYRTPDIMPPSKIGDPGEEAAYIGIYTFVVAIIALSPQSVLSDVKLSRHLQRVLAEDVMPLDKTENVLLKMIRQGYITKTVERTDAEENIEYRVGPRGKIEVGNNGIQGLVKDVYSDSAPDDLDRRLRRSLGIEIAEDMDLDDNDEEDEQTQVSEDPAPSRRSRRR